MPGEISLNGKTYRWVRGGSLVTVTAEDGREAVGHTVGAPEPIAVVLAHELARKTKSTLD
jgi:hypothetical protein